MIVNHEYGFIFLKTRKTASTSIEIALSEHCGPADIITPIAPADEDIRRDLGFRGPQNFTSAAPSAVTRLLRPARLQRFASGRLRFSNHARAAVVRERLGARVWDDYFTFCVERDPFDRAVSRYYWSANPDVSINDYIATAKRKLLSNWPIYAIDDEVAVDRVLRYEDLEPELADVARTVGLPGELVLPRAKTGHRRDRRHYSRILDSRSRARIEDVCERECEVMGYTWTDPAAG